VELWRISRTYVLLNGHARARYDVGSLSLRVWVIEVDILEIHEIFSRNRFATTLVERARLIRI
jgi:hypothetical protein